MSGKDYIKYLEYRKSSKKKLSKKKKQGVLILALCVLGMFLIAILMSDLMYKEPPKGLISKWYDAAPKIYEQSWNNIGKISLIYVAPILLFIVGLSWILHGVQLRILA